MKVNFTAQISKCGQDIEVEVEADVPRMGRLPSYEDEGPTILSVKYKGEDLKPLLTQKHFDKLEQLASSEIYG